MLINFICPICKNPLTKNDKTFVCQKSHAFDVAKEGYVNLTVGSSGKISGDNKEMVNARIAFLNRGYYDNLRAELAKKINTMPHQSVLDVGCGTGYYTGSFFSGENRVFGIDISKLAVKHAAKANKNVEFSVASCYDLPFKDNSFDVVTSVFSPKATSEYARVLKTGGVLIEVCPAADHLIQLKTLLYGQNAYKNEEKSSFDAPFLLEDVKRLTYKFTAKEEDLAALLEMTPYFYKTSSKAKENLVGIRQAELTADFYIKTYRITK